MLGPALPTLAAAWGLADARSGFLLFIQPVSGIVGALLCTRNLFRSIVGGGVSLVAGLLLFGVGRYAFAHLALALTGFGFGLLLTAGNILCGQMGSDDRDRARRLALLNFAWGVGAIISAPIFNAFRQAGHPFAFFWSLAGVIAVVALLCGAGLKAILPAARGEQRPAILPVPVRVLFAVAVLLYSGMEDAISGWLPTYTKRLLHLAGSGNAATFSAYAATAFFAAEVLGRLAMLPVLARFRQRTIYAGALALLLGSMLVVVAWPWFPHGSASSVAAIGMAAIAAGLGVAPVYPLILAMLMGRARTEHGLGWVFAAGGIGGGTLPWLSGAVSGFAGGGMAVRWSFLVPVAAAVALLALRPRLQGANSAQTP